MPQVKEVRTFEGIMNQDVDAKFMRQGDYIDALNIRPSRQGGGFGNMEQLNNISLGVVADQAIVGIFPDNINDLIYVFIADTLDPTTRAGLIKTYDIHTGTVTTVISSYVLNFNTNYPILSFDVSENYIFFTDNYNPPRIIDVNYDWATLGSSLTDESYLNMARLTPLTKPSTDVVTDSGYGYSNITGKFFQFKYRYIYDNKQRSPFSPISNVMYSSNDYSAPKDVAGGELYGNAIDIEIQGINVNELITGVEIAVRSGNNGDFFLVEEILDSGFGQGGSILYRFYNNKLYEPIDLQISNMIYSDVPRLAKSARFIDNRFIMANAKTGYDKPTNIDYKLLAIYNDLTGYYNQSADTKAEVDERLILTDGTGAALGTFLAAQFSSYTLQANDTIIFEGIEDAGDIYDRPFGKVEVEILTGWNNQDVVEYVLSKIHYQYAGSGYNEEKIQFDDLIDIRTFDGVQWGNEAFKVTLKKGTHQKTFKSGAWYNVAIQYYDEYGRTNGVLNDVDSDIYIKTLAERGLTIGNGAGAGATDIKIEITHEAPSWAKYYSIVYSKGNVFSKSIQLTTGEATNGTGDDANNVYININTIATWNEQEGGNLGYVFEKGDMIRLISLGTSASFDNWADELYEANIINGGADIDGGSSGDYFIKVPKFGSAGAIDDADLSGAIVEIFRPLTLIDETETIFTESKLYAIYESSGSYYHRGDVDQTISVDAEVTITGDAYLKTRRDFPYWDITLGTPAIAYDDILFEGYDISDFIDSQHFDLGRPTAILNQEENTNLSTCYYTEKLIPNTDINRLNIVFPDVNFEEYDKNFGEINHLHNDGDGLVMFQEDKVSKILVGKSIMYDAQGNANYLGTQNVILSTAIPYLGFYGLQDPLAITYFANRIFWVDRLRGLALRLSNNGITEISQNGMNSWFNDTCNSASYNGKRLRAVYDPYHDECIFGFNGSSSDAIVFSEMRKGFVNRLSYQVEFGLYINNRTYIISDDLDTLYRKDWSDFPSNPNHNKLGASDLDEPFIEFYSNIEKDVLKNYLAIHLESVYQMDVEVRTDTISPNTTQLSLIKWEDFINREQEWHSPIYRDTNTPDISDKENSGDTIKGKQAKIKAIMSEDNSVIIGDKFYNANDFYVYSIGIIVSKG